MIPDMPSALLSLFVIIVASLFGWTQWQTRRIEARFPPQGVRVETADGAIHMTQRDPVGDARGGFLDHLLENPRMRRVPCNFETDDG